MAVRSFADLAALYPEIRRRSRFSVGKLIYATVSKLSINSFSSDDVYISQTCLMHQLCSATPPPPPRVLMSSAINTTATAAVRVDSH